MIENKNLKLKLGLCGLALTSFLAINVHSTVHADTVDSGNANAITWDSDQDDSQVVKEDSQQDNASRNVQTQGAIQSSVQKQEAPATQSVQSNNQNRAEKSAVRVSNFDTSTVNRLNVDKQRAQAKVANVNATVSNQPVQIVNPQNNQVVVHYVKTNGQEIDDPDVEDQIISTSRPTTGKYAVPTGYTVTNPNGQYQIQDSAITDASGQFYKEKHKQKLFFGDKLTGEPAYNLGKVLNVNANGDETLYDESINHATGVVLDGEIVSEKGWDDAHSWQDSTYGTRHYYQLATLGGFQRIYIEYQPVINRYGVDNTATIESDAIKGIYFGKLYNRSWWTDISSKLSEDDATAIVNWMLTSGVHQSYSFDDGGFDYCNLKIPARNTTFVDNSGNVKSVTGNVVNVAVTKPQSVDPNSAQCKKQATRVIHIAFPNGVKPKSYDSIKDSAGNKLTLDGNNDLVQTVTFTRSKTVDSLTGATLNQTSWQQHGAINAVTLPAIPGYTMVTNN